jgi:glyoxylase-like metal-dependent hydrolase (beta-lactamase superfamily II)
MLKQLAGAATATGLLSGCATNNHPTIATASTNPISVQLGDAIRLTMFQTGWVAVKKPHLEFSGPAALRIPAIITSLSWTDWLPITAFVIEHPEGVFVVDTGETTQMVSDPDYPACDSGSGFFYRHNLKFTLNDADEIGPQMRQYGIDPASVDKVIMTHLHSDHMGGMYHFPQAEFKISQEAIAGHTGALLCRVPNNLNIQPTVLSNSKVGAFEQNQPVTRDGSIKIVPTPGHANGHQSLLIEIEGLSICLVGDAAFSLQQIISGRIGGVVENVSDAKASSQTLKYQHKKYNTIMLPTHDPQNAERLASLGLAINAAR